MNPERRNSPTGIAQAVRNARQSKLAVIFVHVNWSFDTQVVLPTFTEFCEAYHRVRGLPMIGFHCIDFSSDTDGYSALRKIEGWKEIESQRGGGSLIHGQGEVAWLTQGRVLEVKRLGYDATPADLLLKTLSLFRISA